MITDYFFDVRLSEKYDKIAEEKFGSKFIFYSLQYKEEFEEYDKNLKISNIYSRSATKHAYIYGIILPFLAFLMIYIKIFNGTI